METSDSDYFESADEELSSDDDTKTEESYITNKLKEVPIAQDIEETTQQVESTDKGHDVNQSLDAGSQKPSNNDTTKTSTNTNEDGNMIQKKPSRPEFGVPPKKVECWEVKATKIETITLDNTRKIENTSSTKSSVDKRSEFGIPPRRVDCWFDDVNNINKSNTLPVFEKNLKKENVTNVTNPSRLEYNHDILLNPVVTTEENMWNNDESWDEIQENITEKVTLNTDAEKNMWDDNDDWEPVSTNVNQNDEHLKVKNTGWGGWSTWGLSTVISTASTLTSHVSQSLGTVLETGIGVPEPEELARIDKLEKQKEEIKEESISEQTKQPPMLGFGLGNFVHGVTQITKLVETTGNKVLTGGLDTLETIGKKTMEVLQENDPGLKKKRAFLKLDDDKPILSQLLREAKEKAEAENALLERKHIAHKANYETLFDDHQGLVHLEALEMLSKQCDIKLQTILEGSTGDVLVDIQETMDQVRELCELPEEEDEDMSTSIDEIIEKLDNAASEIGVNITYDNLKTKWKEVETWLDDLRGLQDLHRQAIETLAQLTAISVERFHKTGELLLVKDRRSTADEADSLVQLTMMLTALISVVASRFSEKLNLVQDKDVKDLLTNVYFEAANSSSYIKDAFQLLIPVIQVGAL